MMVENAIRKHGNDNDNSDDFLSNIATEVQSECQNEWPASGEKWVVLYSPIGAVGIFAGNASKILYIQDSDKGFVYAARITL